MSDSVENSDNPKIAGILLAAGASSRLGRPKQLVTYNGTPLVCHAASQALAFCDAGLIAVTGAHHDDVAAALEGMFVKVVYSSGWSEGIAASIRQGVTSIRADADAILLMVCDQPLVTSKDLRNLVNAWNSNPERIAAAEYGGNRGVPAIFPNSLRESLLSLSGDRGAKGIIDATRGVSVVPMPHALFDVDTPEHLNKIDG